MLKLAGISKSFGSDNGRHVRAVDELSLEIADGQLAALMGPNGSGKTTVFRLIDRQLRPDEGQVLLNGIDINDSSTNRSGTWVAHLPQDPRALAFPEMTLEEHLLWAEKAGRPCRFWRPGITVSRRRRYRELLQRYDVPHLAEALDQPLRTLSGGWQQIFIFLLAVAGSLLRDDQRGPSILMLDEPTSALDATNARRCIEIIKRLHDEGRTILIATHDAELAVGVAQRVCVLNEGRLIADLQNNERERLAAQDLRRILLLETHEDELPEGSARERH